MKRLLKWIRAHPKSSLAWGGGLIFLAMNAVAFMHAWRFTHYGESGERTGRPESLSFWTKGRLLLTGVSVPRPLNSARPGRPFETHFFSTSDGLTLEAWHIPHPAPKGMVLMFHGYGGVKSHLLAEADAVHAMGFDTFLVDFRGCGGSDGSETSIGFHEADDVAAALAFVRSELGAGKVFLFARSMGSAAVLRAVAVHDLKPDGIIVACPFDRLSTTVKNRFRAMGAPTFPGTQLLLFWGGVQQGFWGFDHNPVEFAAGVSCPTLHLQGDEDSRVTPEQARSIFENLAGPKTYVEFKEVGHNRSYLASDPETWIRVVSTFLADRVGER